MTPRLGPGFEWFVAWRHIRDPEKRTRWVLWAGLGLLVLGAVLFAVSLRWGPAGSAQLFLPPRETLLWANLRMVGVWGMVAGAMLAFAGAMFASFTVFTAIPILGVFLGTGGPVVVLSVMTGFETDLKTKIRGAKADVVITRNDDQPFVDVSAVLARLAPVPGVVAATPFIESEVMVRAGNTPAGIVLRGIDPVTAPKVLNLDHSTLREGQVSDLADPGRAQRAARLRRGEDPPDLEDDLLPTMLMGEELYAHLLRLVPGSRVEVVCPLCGTTPLGPGPRARDFRVAGHFYTGMYEFDSKLAYISLGEAQKFLQMPGEISGIDVRATSPEASLELARRVAAILGSDYDVRSWQDLNRALFAALKLEKIAFEVALGFIALVASFSISANLIMMVSDKGREIAILKSMGARDGAIFRIFIAEGLYVGLIGGAFGMGTGVTLCRLIERFGLSLPTDVYYISSLPVVIRESELVTVAALALALCCMATLYPASLAARLRPVDGLRHE